MTLLYLPSLNDLIHGEIEFEWFKFHKLAMVIREYCELQIAIVYVEVNDESVYDEILKELCCMKFNSSVFKFI